MLVHLDRCNALLALVIIGREIAISSLREWMAQIGASKSVAVHMLGKWKTTMQMVAIPFLLFNGELFGLIDTHLWGTWLLVIAAVLTIWSMVYYLQKAIPEIRAEGARVTSACRSPWIRVCADRTRRRRRQACVTKPHTIRLSLDTVRPQGL